MDDALTKQILDLLREVKVEVIERLDGIDSRLEGIDAKLVAQDRRFGQVEIRLKAIEDYIAVKH